MKISSFPLPKIYGIPKLHKEGRSLRSVVLTIGFTTYQMAQFLTGVLENVVGKTEHHVKISFEFAQQITRMQIPEEHVLFSLYVNSVYKCSGMMESIEAWWSEVYEDRHTKFLACSNVGL